MQGRHYLLCFLGFFLFVPLSFADISHNPHVMRFMHQLETHDGFHHDYLVGIFKRVNFQKKVTHKLLHSKEKTLHWYQYRRLFLTKERIKNSVIFWQQQDKWLQKAKQQYGVDPAIIVATLSIETKFGKRSGKYPVIRALSTLAFDRNPDRADFFTRELRRFFLLCRNERFNPLNITGSYAGAIGIPQFMPGSYLSYAVDFDGDGVRDLQNNVADSIGSVANYYARHHWRLNKKVTTQVQIRNPQLLKHFLWDYRLRYSIHRLIKAGISIPQNIHRAKTLVGLMAFMNKPQHYSYWLTFHNFNVITRYNTSPLYAMAVSQLADAIRLAKTRVKPHA